MLKCAYFQEIASITGYIEDVICGRKAWESKKLETENEQLV